MQALNYLKRLREGAQTKNGRSIPNADQIPGFVYVLADLTNHLIECCDLWQLQKTADGMGILDIIQTRNTMLTFRSYLLTDCLLQPKNGTEYFSTLWACRPSSQNPIM